MPFLSFLVDGVLACSHGLEDYHHLRFTHSHILTHPNNKMGSSLKEQVQIATKVFALGFRYVQCEA